MGKLSLSSFYTEFEKKDFSGKAVLDDDDAQDIADEFTQKLRRKINLHDVSELAPNKAYELPYTNFNRFYNIYKENELSSLTSYIFMTRPDCNMPTNTNEDTGDPYWVNALYNHNMVEYLSSNSIASNHDFIPFLTDRVESFQVPDTNLKQFNTAQPLSGWLLNYAGNANESLTGSTIDVTFRDDVDLRITRLVQNWVMYIDKVVKGEIVPKYEYMQYKIFDYMSSIYYFVCDPTASRILMYSKFTGVFPINVPLSSWSHNLHGTPDSKVNVTFAYSILEHNNLDIIRDFNCNAKMKQHREDCSPSNFRKTDYVPNYNSKDMAITSTVGRPFIASNGDSRLYLRWKDE